MAVKGESIQRILDQFGIDKEDQNYQTAVVVRLLQRALQDGDTGAIRMLTELTGELGRFGFSLADDPSVETIDAYPTINLPSNGRDAVSRQELSPQAGPQTMFMCSPADIIIYGGAAGGGKTFALLLECLRHKDVEGFSGVIFRKNYTQITASGGLWDASHKVFRQVQGASPHKTPKLNWSFGGKGKIHFAHLSCEDDLMSWQGTEICLLAFDELTHFSRHQFLYMLSRNRSTCGVRPYVRATCNPDSDSWVANFIEWWIDQETGYPIAERSGQIRYMCVLDDVIYWGNTPQDLYNEHGVTVEECKSVTFIASKLTDNKVLMTTDPSYMANLKAMTQVDKERLLEGNWKIRPSAGMYFKATDFEFVDVAPCKIVAYARSWDLAATEPSPSNNSPDATAGVLMGKLEDGRFIILDVKREQIKANAVRELARKTAILDDVRYKYVQITIPQDPGQAGKEQAHSYVKMLAGHSVEIVSPSGSKTLRATPFASQVQAGNVLMLKAQWNEMYLAELESFPEGLHDDMVDASSDAFNKLNRAKNWAGLIT